MRTERPTSENGVASAVLGAVNVDVAGRLQQERRAVCKYNVRRLNSAASSDERNRRAAEIECVRAAELQIDRGRLPGERLSSQCATRIEGNVQRVRSVQVNRAARDVRKFTGVDIDV